jgi:hypothetical protein
MHSRKILHNEQWFPTKTLDWVQLSDGTFGQVKLQTVEQVVIEIKNAEKKYYSTTDYLNLRPVNLSHFYTIDFLWSLDYSIQNELISQVLPKIQTLFKSALNDRKVPYENLIIEFNNAGANSLNLYFEIKLLGQFAARKIELTREMQTIMLEVSNELKLNIPFNQLVLHNAQTSM